MMGVVDRKLERYLFPRCKLNLFICLVPAIWCVETRTSGGGLVLVWRGFGMNWHGKLLVCVDGNGRFD